MQQISCMMTYRVKPAPNLLVCPVLYVFLSKLLRHVCSCGGTCSVEQGVRPMEEMTFFMEQ